MAENGYRSGNSLEAFKSSLSLKEIEDNFREIDLYMELVRALSEAVELSSIVRGYGESKEDQAADMQNLRQGNDI